MAGRPPKRPLPVRPPTAATTSKTKVLRVTKKSSENTCSCSASKSNNNQKQLPSPDTLVNPHDFSINSQATVYGSSSSDDEEDGNEDDDDEDSNAAKRPTVFAEGREGALLPLVPLAQLMRRWVRRSCHRWELVRDQVVCAGGWRLSLTAQVLGRDGRPLHDRPGASPLFAKVDPWPPVLFPDSNNERLHDT